MSFYGNVTYYLSNAFQKIVYRNTGSKYTSTTGEQSNGYSDGPSQMPAYEYILNPRNGSDSAILETGNKWLQFADPDGTIGQNQIKIFHKISEQEAGSAQISGSIDFGSTIGVPVITFDEAGHITNIASQNFTLPENPGLLDINDLKARIADLEALVTGTYSDPGDEQQQPSIPEEGSINSQLQKIYKTINEWDLKVDGASAAINQYKESKGIGSTLHDVMVLLGMRQSRIYEEDGETKTGYLNIEGNPSGLINDVSTTLTLARSTFENVVSNRLGIVDLIKYLKSNSVFTVEQIAELELHYPPFNENGD